MSIAYLYQGNQNLFDKYTTAFLCSRKCPAHIVLKSYDWALERRDKKQCVISGFHSKIENDVLHFLLKGEQPVILALARGLQRFYNPEIQTARAQNRLLIITPFEKSIKRITSETAKIRNQLMCDLADEIFVAYASPESKLIPLIKSVLLLGKPIFTFDATENDHLIRLGVEKYILNK